MSIGDNIRQFRLDKKLSQSELARAVGVTQSMIAQIERGSKVPSMPLGADIANTLHCDINELISSDKGN